MFVGNESYDIIATRGHYEVYCDGKFFCSADTFMEAVREINGEKQKKKE